MQAGHSPPPKRHLPVANTFCLVVVVSERQLPTCAHLHPFRGLKFFLLEFAGLGAEYCISLPLLCLFQYLPSSRTKAGEAEPVYSSQDGRR